MSLRILGQYGSDSSSDISDSDDDDNNNKALSELGGSKFGGGREEESTPPVCTDPLSLAGEGESEESDSDDDSSPPDESHPLTTPLPLPDIDKMVARNDSYFNSELVTKSHLYESTQDRNGLVVEEEHSVFFNPYKKAEDRKLAMLKQHVTEFDKKPENKTKTPRNKYDWSHTKKSRVERSQDIKGGSFTSTHHRGGSVPVPSPSPHHTHTGSHRTLMQFEESSDDLFDDSDALKKRKHRSGVKDSLVPPKKFLKLHEKIQSKERPWTMKR